MANFYPEEEAEKHGLGPDTWNQPAVYALDLDAPTDIHDLRARWYSHFDVEPPEPLVTAVDAGREVIYVGYSTDKEGTPRPPKTHVVLRFSWL